MQLAFRISSRRWYPALFGAVVIIVDGLVIWLAPPAQAFALLFTGTSVIGGLVYFMYTQHLQETRLFAELFRQFNERYDKLNGPLNAILLRRTDSMLELSEQQVLYDYFNLCAEEYLYFKSGYIDSEVWASWLRGMLIYLSSKEIQRLWEAELEAGSYYGFKLSLVKNAASQETPKSAVTSHSRMRGDNKEKTV